MKNAILLVAVVLGGCGYASVDGDGAAITTGEDGLASGIVIKGDLACMQTVSDKVSAVDTFDGYTFAATRAQVINLKTQTAKRARLMVYGPQKANGNWGNAFFKEWVEYSSVHGAYTISVPVTLPAAGKYLVTLGSYTKGAMSYDLNLTCTAQPHCVEYVSTDEAGVSLRNFYAIDVASYDEGKQLVSQMNGQLVEEAINPGTCAEQSTACPFYFRYAPVCGDVATDDPGFVTFDSVCAFKVAIRQATVGSQWNGSKGHWEDGACAAYCVSWRGAVDGLVVNEFYADNVATYEEGKDLLASFGVGYFAEESIAEGPCANQQIACTDVWAPVCGDVQTDADPASTYGDGCAFRAAVVAAAGVDAKAWGSFEKGECAAACPADEMPYVTHTPEVCRMIRMYCTDGTVPFSNACGCGCKPAPLSWFVSCGTPVCYENQAPPAGVRACSADEIENQPCGTADDRCVPPVDLGCGRTLVCAQQQPTICPK